MADKRILQERIVRFGITGMDEVYDAQKKITSNARAALKDQKELLKTLEEGTEAYKKQSKNVDAANKYYERQKKLLDDLLKQTNTIKDVIENRTVESAKKMESAIKAIIKGVKSISLKDMDEGEAEKMRGHIAGLVKDMTGLQAQVHAIGNGFQDMTAKLKISDLTIEEATRYIKTFEQHGRALADSTENSGAAFAKMGENATNLKLRIAVLDGTLKKLSDGMSREEVEKNMNFWKQMSEYSHASTEQVKLFTERYREAQGLLIDKSINKLSPLAIIYQSPDDIKKSVEYLQKIAQEENLNAAAQEKVNDAIARGTDYLKKFHDVAKYKEGTDMFRRMSIELRDIDQLTKEGITEQQKYWETVKNKAKEGSNEMRIATENLKALNEETARRESERVKAEGATIVGQVNTGVFAGTIKETEEAIQKIQAYKKELQVSGDAKAIKETEKALATLNEKLAQTRTEVLEGAKTFTTLRSAARRGVDAVTEKLPASAEKLRQMRENLEAYKKSLKNATPEKLQQINTVLTAIDRKEKEVAANEIKWSQYKGAELKKRSLDELRKAYDVLKKEIETLSPAQAKYNEKAMQMRQINERVKQLNNTMSHHVSSLENAASRLKNYVMIYFGFNAAMMKTRQIIQNVIELSDQMTNVQKVTQLTTEEIEHMTNAIQSIDTRTANQELMEMAEQAGKLGIATREGADGLVSFVKEGQKIVNTLGDIGGAEAITELLKVNDVVNKNRQGLEKDLNRIGSAILNVGNNSKATYADVVEFTKRLGATGSVTGLTMEQIMGLGGAFSSLGESMERSSTATQRVILGIVSHTEAVAKAVNVGYDELDQLIQAGKTFEALELVLTELGQQGPAVYDAFFKAIGGRNNVQARNAMALLSQHIEELNYQVALAEEGFAEGTLVTQEFERANNNLAGVMAQISNEFYEMTTSVEGSNGALLTLAKWLLEVTKWMRENNVIGQVLIATLLVLTKSLIQNTAAWWANAKATMMNEAAYKGFKGTLFGLIQIIVQSIKWIGYQSMALLGSASAAEKARIAADRLKIAWSSNWITLALVALGLLIGKLMATAKATSDARKSLGELIKKGEEEINVLNTLYKSLQNVNLAQQDRANKINTFNRLFGSYLSNILTEENVAKRLGIAYREAAAAIREKNAAALEEKAQQAAEEESGDRQREALGAMTETLGKTQVYGKKLSGYEQQSMIASIQAAVIQAAESGMSEEEIRKEVIKRLSNDHRFLSSTTFSTVKNGKREEYNAQQNILTGEVYKIDKGKKTVVREGAWKKGQRTNLQTAVDEFINATVKGENAKKPFYLQAEGQRAIAQEEEIKLIEELRKQILAQQDTKNPIKQRELYKNITQYRQLYKKYEKDSRLNKGESVYIKNFEDMLPELLEVVHPWGQTAIDFSGQAGHDIAANAVDYFNNIYNDWKKGQKILRTSAYKPPVGVTIPSDIDFWSKEKFRDWAYLNWQEAKKRLESENFDNPAGNFKDFPEKKDRKRGQKEKEEFEAAIASLDKYYKDRETLINISLNNEEITESEANRRKETLEAEHLMKRSQLRRDAIGKMDSGEMKAFETWWDGIEELDKVNFKRLREQSQEWGKAYVQGVALASSKDLSEIEKMLQEHKQKIDKILQEGDSVKKVTDAFQQAMDDLDMIFAIREEEAKRTAALGNRRLTQLMEWSKKAYSIDVDFLKAQMSETGNIYHEWFESLGKDQDRTLQAMLVRLRQYHDDMDEVVRKSAKERKRLFDMVYNNSIGASGMTRQQENTMATDRAKTAIAGQQLSQRWGYGGDHLTNDAELNLINLQIEQKLKYVEALKAELDAKKALNEEQVNTMMLQQGEERGRLGGIMNSDEYSEEEKMDAKNRLAELDNQLAQKRLETSNLELETNVLLAESEKELAELRTEQINEQIENYQRLFDYLKEMQGNFEGFAESFGQGVFGSKEDRKNAALDLVADVLKTTKQVTQAYLTEIVTKRAADQTVVAMEEQKNVQLAALRSASLANYGATKIAELGVETATTSAEVTEAITKGTAKEVSKHGLTGLATAAAIGVGLSILLGLALGALNKAKSATAAATGASSGAGKLATGMLTYGKGRYPVYAEGVYANDGSGRTQGQLVSVPGNDGRTYMAKYQPNLKTGVVNSPHLGIVGEKGAELIVDHQTYEGLRRYDPETLRRIYAMRAYGTRSIDFERTARMGNEVVMNRGGVRAYADGNIDEKLGGMDDGTNAYDGTMVEMKQTLADLTVVLATIKETGIDAHMNYFGRNGAWETDKRGQKFLKRKGIT